LPTHVFIKAREGLNHNSIVLLEQIRTIDKKRLIRKLGVLKHFEMKTIYFHLMVSIGINFYENSHIQKSNVFK